MHRLDGGHERFAFCAGSLADFAGRVVGNLAATPGTLLGGVQQEHPLEAAEQHFVGGILVPLGNVEVVAHVHVVIDDGDAPLGLGVARLVVGDCSDAIAFAAFVATPVQRQHDEVVRAGGGGKPPHAVGGGLVLELNRRPFLCPVGGRDQVKHGAGLGGVTGFARVPLCACGDLGPAIAVDVAHGDADVVALSEVLDDDVFLPRRVLVPGDVAGVAQDDVRFLVAVHVGDGGAVADLYLGVDGDVAKLGQVGGLAAGDRGQADEGGGECCEYFHGTGALWGQAAVEARAIAWPSATKKGRVPGPSSKSSFCAWLRSGS